MPRSNIRLRYDDAYNMNRPDRAENLLSAVRVLLLGKNTPFYASVGNATPRAAFGPPLLETKINNIQEYSTYVEYAPLRTCRYSWKCRCGTSIPRRTRTPSASEDDSRVQYAFIAQPDAFYTFQFRTYVPTGAGGSRPGNEPCQPGAWLARLPAALGSALFRGRVPGLHPCHGSTSVAVPDKPFAGNVLNYGMGAFYNMVLTE